MMGGPWYAVAATYRKPVVGEHGEPAVIEAPAARAADPVVGPPDVTGVEERALPQPEALAAVGTLAQFVGHGLLGLWGPGGALQVNGVAEGAVVSGDLATSGGDEDDLLSGGEGDLGGQGLVGAGAGGVDSHAPTLPSSSSSVEHERLDELELAMLAHGSLIDNPVEHLFLPGLYVRQITNWKGSVLTTKIHKTEHPFFLLKGRLLVRSLDGEVVELVAPCRGVTQPGTRRVIVALEDSVFVTVHPNPDDGQDLGAIEERLIEPRELLDGKTSGQLFAERRAEELNP